MPGAQELANVIKKDDKGNFIVTPEAEKIFYKRVKQALSEGSISLPFKCAEPFPVFPGASNIDIEDKERYPDFHSFWVDGILKSVAVKLNVPQNFLIPIFDPLALGQKLGLPQPLPPISIESAAVSFAAPVPIAFDLLEVDPLDLPKVISKAFSLVNPQLPSLPNMALAFPDMALKFPFTPNLNMSDPYGLTQINFELNLGINLAFLKLIQEIAKPDFWLSFTLTKIFELSCKTLQKPILDPFTSPATGQKSPPITGIACATTVATMAADMTGFAVTTSTVGGGVVLETQAVELEYKKPEEKKSKNPEDRWHQAAKEDPTLMEEAPLNRLVPFIPDPDECDARWVFTKSGRNTFFADHWIVELLTETGKRIKKLNNEGKISSNDRYILEVGNLSGRRSQKDTYLYDPSLAKEGVWRWSPWSDRQGAAGEKPNTSHAGSHFDYAYPFLLNGKRVSGTYPGHIVIEGSPKNNENRSPIGISTERIGKSNSSAAYRGDRPFIDPSLGDVAKFKYEYDWESLYELMKVMCIYVEEKHQEGKLLQANGKPFKNIVQVFGNYIGGANIGDKIASNFKSWMTANRSTDSSLSKEARNFIINGAFGNVDKNHNDHLHFYPNRSWKQDDGSYIIRPSGRILNRFKKEIPDPRDGDKKITVVW